MPTLIAYASLRGSTAEISQRIQSVLRSKGISAEVMDIKDITDDKLSKYTSFIVGSAVIDFEWLPLATSFLRNHASTFNTVPTWGFSVGCPTTVPKRFADAWHAHDEDQLLEANVKREVKDIRGVKLLHGKFLKSHFGLVLRVFWTCFGGTEGDLRNWEDIEAWAAEIGDEILRIHGAPAISIQSS